MYCADEMSFSFCNGHCVRGIYQDFVKKLLTFVTSTGALRCDARTMWTIKKLVPVSYRDEFNIVVPPCFILHKCSAQDLSKSFNEDQSGQRPCSRSMFAGTDSLNSQQNVQLSGQQCAGYSTFLCITGIF